MLEELNLLSETSWVELDSLKQNFYAEINRNRRLSAIEDTDHKISFPKSSVIVQISSRDLTKASPKSDPPYLLVLDRHVRQKEQDFLRYPAFPRRIN